MIHSSVTHHSPLRSSITRVGATHTYVSPARQVSTTVHRPATTVISSPVRRSVTVTSPLRATTVTGVIERARPVLDTTGLTRSISVVRGALPTSKTYGRAVHYHETGITSPVKPPRLLSIHLLWDKP